MLQFPPPPPPPLGDGGNHSGNHSSDNTIASNHSQGNHSTRLLLKQLPYGGSSSGGSVVHGSPLLGPRPQRPIGYRGPTPLAANVDYESHTQVLSNYPCLEAPYGYPRGEPQYGHRGAPGGDQESMLGQGESDVEWYSPQPAMHRGGGQCSASPQSSSALGDVSEDESQGCSSTEGGSCCSAMAAHGPPRDWMAALQAAAAGGGGGGDGGHRWGEEAAYTHTLDLPQGAPGGGVTSPLV